MHSAYTIFSRNIIYITIIYYDCLIKVSGAWLVDRIKVKSKASSLDNCSVHTVTDLIIFILIEQIYKRYILKTHS